jgi:hypothetical protein
MGISDWFTIFGLLLAVYALYSSEERTILVLKLGKYDPQVLLIAIFLILVLIKYDDILHRFPNLYILKASWGLHSSSWALILFLAVLGYYGYKLYSIPNQVPNSSLIQYYRKFMKRSFESFYILFNKYELKSTDRAYFSFYKSIIFDPVFIESNTKEPYYYIEYLDVVDNTTFEFYFKHLIGNNESIFYKELKSNDDSYLVNEDNYFLYKLLHEKPGQFIDIRGLKIIKDWYLVHLQNENLKGSQSIYNQSTEQLIDDLEIKFPLCLHILFVQLLYQEAIFQKIDLGDVSTKYKNMQSIYSNMIEKCIAGIDKNNYQIVKDHEYPTYYHLMISRIFTVIKGWIKAFNDDENYIENSSYVGFFPFCLHVCISELVKGFRKNVGLFTITCLTFITPMILKNLLKTKLKNTV